MKKYRLIAVAIFLVILFSPPLMGVEPNADWRAVVGDAYARSDLVVSGTVQTIDDQRAVDGGHVYGIRVNDIHKGPAGQVIQVRAGGFFYLVPLDRNESVLLFLRSVKSGSARSLGGDYALVDAEGLKPMVFRYDGRNAQPVDARLSTPFASVSASDIETLLNSIKP